jgi:ssRNA-specific RNase YbeY (16S rRNA maturation enzyme)
MDNQNLDIKNKGVEILLNRMDSHPEEFTERRNLGARSRWDWIIEQVSRRVLNSHKSDSKYRLDLPFLSDEEVDALHDKYQQLQGQAFTNRIMSELLDEPEESLAEKQMELFANQAISSTQAIRDAYHASQANQLGAYTSQHITGQLGGASPKKLIVPRSMLEAAQRLLNSHKGDQ